MEGGVVSSTGSLPRPPVKGLASNAETPGLVRLEIRAGKSYTWPDQLLGVSVTNDQVTLLRTDLQELFALLKRHGFGRGAEGIRRTVEKVSTRKRVKTGVRKKIEMAESIKYARLPSYGGG
jgi:hypothetical protein